MHQRTTTTILVALLLTVPAALAATPDRGIDASVDPGRAPPSSGPQVAAPGVLPPDGGGTLDPWLDATGDTLFGDIEVGVHAIAFHGRALEATPAGELLYGGEAVCLDVPGTCGSTTVYTGSRPIEVVGPEISLSTDGCITGDVWKWDGLGWQCLPDEDTTTPAWNDIALMPAGFADDTDDDTLGALACADGEVAKAFVGGWTCGADEGATSVDWSDITSIPAGFADGVDDDAGGDITAVNAGPGLTGGGSTGDVGLAVDTSAVQTRVAGTCAAGSAIRAIGSDGAVTCELDDDTDTNTDTLAELSCADDAIARLVSGTWTCSTDQVDGGNADLLDSLDSTQLLRSDVDGTLDGTLQLTGDLHVAGDITTSSKVRHLAIAGSTFTPGRSSISYHSAQAHLFGTSSGQSVEFRAPVNLPHGSVVTGVTADVYDATPDENVALSMGRVGAGTSSTMAFLTTSTTGTPGWTQATDTSIASPTIDNDGSAYLLTASWTTPPTSTDIRLGKVTITYTVDTPLQ